MDRVEMLKSGSLKFNRISLKKKAGSSIALTSFAVQFCSKSYIWQPAVVFLSMRGYLRGLKLSINLLLSTIQLCASPNTLIA